MSRPSPVTGEGTKRASISVKSRDAAAGAPAFERGPDAAVEPEAVDRRRALEGANAIEADAGPLEAAFLQHPARGRVGDARARLHRLVAELRKGVVDRRAGRFGGVAVAPIGRAEPIAEIG